MIITQIEDTFKSYFQSNIRVSFGNSTLKQGRFIILKPNTFSLDFYIKTPKMSGEILSLPLPLKFYKDGTTFVFDYTLDEITIKDSPVYNEIMDYIRKNKTSKYIHNKINIQFN